MEMSYSVHPLLSTITHGLNLGKVRSRTVQITKSSRHPKTSPVALNRLQSWADAIL